MEYELRDCNGNFMLCKPDNATKGYFPTGRVYTNARSLVGALESLQAGSHTYHVAGTPEDLARRVIAAYESVQAYREGKKRKLGLSRTNCPEPSLGTDVPEGT
jgi:hypothetical protein